MNRQDARAHRNTFTLAIYRLRHLLDEPTSEERLRAMYELGKQTALTMANKVTEAWRKPQEEVQIPVPLVSVPSIIDGIAGGPEWPGSVGSWTALNAGRAPHRHREPDMLVAVSGVPMPREDWLNSKPDVREELFADVVNAESIEEDETDDGNAPTILTPKAKRDRQFNEALDGLRGA